MRQSVLPTGHDKAIRLFENLRNQLRRGCLRVKPQKGFGAGRPEKDPGSRSIVVIGSVQKELHSIHVFFFYYFVITQGAGRTVARSLNGSLFHILGNVQVAATVKVWTKVTLQVGYQLSQRLAPFRHDVGEQQ